MQKMRRVVDGRNGFRPKSLKFKLHIQSEFALRNCYA